MVSSRNLSTLPEIDALRNRLQQMSALQAVFGIEYGTTDYEFHPLWDHKEQMGAYKNGSGDELFVHFTPAGCFIKGFAHESLMSPFQKDPPDLWPGLLSSVPPEFESSLKEPAFDIAATTFVIWRQLADSHWQTGEIAYPNHPDPDGSNDLLSKIIATAPAFAEWLAENYEVEVNENIVDHVFQNLPLSDDQLRTLNPNAELQDLRKAVQETGYALKQ